MRSVTKLVLIGSFLVFSLLTALATVSADDSKQRIYDFANLLSSEELDELEQLADEHSKKRKTDFIIVISPDAEGKVIKTYFEDIYDEIKPGYDKPSGSTVMLTLDLKNREFFLGSFEDAQDRIDSQRVDLLYEKVIPLLRDDKYYETFETFIETGSRYMRYIPRVNPESFLFDTWFHILVAIGIGGFSVATMAYNTGGKVTVNERTYTGDVKVLKRTDTYLTKNVTRRKKPSNNNRGGGGGASRGVTRGGSSYTGRGGRF